MRVWGGVTPYWLYDHTEVVSTGSSVRSSAYIRLPMADLEQMAAGSGLCMNFDFIDIRY